MCILRRPERPVCARHTDLRLARVAVCKGVWNENFVNFVATLVNELLIGLPAVALDVQ